ncbi:GNAT family N-acetyltransferase [Candidatus Acetothermia bacterium]|nr:GNAT family N-acetyltransferase [Candidatus Acetothermia bacterium]
MRSTECFCTDRLIAERITDAHSDELLRMHRDEKVMATLGGVRTEQAWTREFLNKSIAHWNQRGFGLWVFRDITNGEFVGRGGLRHILVAGSDEIELAYALMSEYWGQGFATEIAKHSLQIGFEMLHLTNIVCFTMTTNYASQRVMQKAGFTYERNIIHAHLPHVFYRMTALDWKKQQKS